MVRRNKHRIAGKSRSCECNDAHVSSAANHSCSSRQVLFGRFGKLLTTALIIAIFFIFAMYGSYRNYLGLSDLPKEKYDSLSQTATKKIAIIKVKGRSSKGTRFHQEADRPGSRGRDASRESCCGSTRLAAPSPAATTSIITCKKSPKERKHSGGRQHGRHLRQRRLLHRDGRRQTRRRSIFAEPTTWTGSIGVIIPHYKRAGLMEQWDVERGLDRQRTA